METKIARVVDGRQETSDLYLSDKAFGCSYNPTLVHQVLVVFHANHRRCCSAQKTRGSVHHSTKKLYKQKGLGRARAGMSSVPTRRGGGRAFPNSSGESFNGKINKRSHKLMLRYILSCLAKEKRLTITDTATVQAVVSGSRGNSTPNLNFQLPALFVVDPNELTNRLYLAVRNHPKTSLVSYEELNPRILLTNRRIILTERSVLKVQELLQ